MSYTIRNGQPQGVPTNFLSSIREALIAEIIAINGYSEHIANSNIGPINDVWEKIRQDEKDHYGMFMSLLHQYDPVQCQMFKKYAVYNSPQNPIWSPQAYIPDLDKQLILNNIRDDIKGEFEAVILYEQNLRVMPYNDIKNVFIKVIEQEKEHAEHLSRVLLQFDPSKYDGL